MKNLNKKILMITTMIIFVLFSDFVKASELEAVVENEEGKLFFNPEDVKNRTGDYSALSDIYGVEVFSQDFEYREFIYKQLESSKKESLFNLIMSSDFKGQSFEKDFNKVMSAQEQTIIKGDMTVQKSKSGLSITALILLLIIVSLFFLFVILDMRKRILRRRANFEDNFDYYNTES